MLRFNKRPRLKGFAYTGCYRYFITICTYRKCQAFCDKEVVTICLESLKEKSRLLNFKVWAYCFMPDHLHLLLEGKTKDADLKKMIAMFKQISAYQYRQNVGQRFSAEKEPILWQPSFYDHVLRKNEDLFDVVRYILNNPVRKGLVRHYTEYMYSGSLVLKDGIEGAL